MSPAHLVSIDLRAIAAALAELGPERAPAIELARAAGVAKPTLYSRFGSREALVEACVQHEAEQLVERVARADGAGSATAEYARESPGWPLLLLSRHPAAIAARGRVAARIASGRPGTSRAAAAAFLAAAATVLELEPVDGPSLAELEGALLH